MPDQAKPPTGPLVSPRPPASTHVPPHDSGEAPPGYHTAADALAVFMDMQQKSLFHEWSGDELEKAAQIIEDEAKRVIGTYEYDWPPLQPETIARKGADTPLYETGELRDSIEHHVDRDALTAQVGSNDPVAVFQELGTVTIPARSFLMGAAMRKEREIVEMTGVDIHGLMLKQLGID